jgi:chromosome segregation ATPase
VRDEWRQETRASQPAEAFGWNAVLEGHAQLSPAERAALPPAAFVDHLAEALSLSEKHPSVTFVTRGGEVVRGPIVRVSGSSTPAAGLFALRRDEEALRGRLQEARQELRGSDAAVDRLRSDRQRREEALPPLRDFEREAQGLQRAFAARLEERLAERDRLRRERDTIAEEERALSEQVAGFQTGRRTLEDEERRHAEQESTAHERVVTLSASLAEARSLAMGAAEELAHRRTEAEVAAERRRAMEAARNALLESQSTLERRLAEASEEETRIAARSAELSQEETDARERQ